MTRRIALAVIVVLAGGLLLPACGGAQEPAEGSLPSPREAIPRAPAALARALTDTSRDLHAAIDRWRATGDPSRGRTPEDVTLLALYQQRLYMFLGTRPGLASEVRPLLRGAASAEARDILTARRTLERLNRPVRRVRFRTGRALPPDALRRLYRRAERRFGVPWEVLAAINFVETGFNKIRSNSSAGAQGPMQFIPSTWRAYGMGGNVRDPRDAIMGAANYLRASGAPRRLGRALFAYNPSRLYVRAVRGYARRIRRRPQALYAFHSWQIFVRTTRGLRRLTGPGL